MSLDKLWKKFVRCTHHHRKLIITPSLIIECGVDGFHFGLCTYFIVYKQFGLETTSSITQAHWIEPFKEGMIKAEFKR